MFQKEMNVAIKMNAVFLFVLFYLFHTGTGENSADLKCSELKESCGACVANSDCFYCNPSKTCHSYKLIPKGCSKAQWYVNQCTISGFWLIIVLPCVAVILAISLICCCWWCCCKKDSAKVEEKYRLKESKRKAEKEQRQAYFEERNQEREVERERIRSKYGLYNNTSSNDVTTGRYQRISDEP